MEKLPWQISPAELFVLRGNGGQTFTEFMDALVRAESIVAGLDARNVKTNIRVNIGDGGVDTSVDGALGGPFNVQTNSCWQYKATDFSEVTAAPLKEEANKPEARRLIQAGFAYHVCVCDDQTAEKLNALNATLRAEVLAINPNAAAAHVLGAGQLAQWANRHPPIILRYFRNHHGAAITYEAWLKKETSNLPVFVELTDRQQAADQIRDHASAKTVTRAAITVRGPVGAGGSRLVAQALSAIAPRIMYVPEQDVAISLATSLINQPDATAVLVIDRCKLRTQLELTELLHAERNRLRVVILVDPAEPESQADVELEPLAAHDVHKVIEANFKHVPGDARRAFVDLSDGILKIAAQLAHSYEKNPSESLSDAASWANNQLRRYLPDEKDRKLLAALSLFSRVNWASDGDSSFTTVCRFLGVDVGEALDQLRRMSRSPGVAKVGPRYLSVRPRLFAKPMFEEAWQRHVTKDLNSFLSALPATLQDALLLQASLHATPAIRDSIAEWAESWVAGLSKTALSNRDELSRLVLLVQVNPSALGPKLIDLVLGLSDKEVGGENYSSLVWALQPLLERRETYALAEQALFRLAKAEGDPEKTRFSPSAREIWAASFRMFLSGTEHSYVERLEVLKERARSLQKESPALLVSAFDFALSGQAFKVSTAPFIGGEIKPGDWQPATNNEIHDGLDAAVALVGIYLKESSLQAPIVAMLSKHIRSLVQTGRVKALADAFDGVTLGEPERVKVLDAVNDFMIFDVEQRHEEQPKDHRYPKEYIDQVVAFRESLRRKDLTGRVHQTLAINSYYRQRDAKEEWDQELKSLSEELISDRETFATVLPGLNTGTFGGANLFALGDALGRADSRAVLLDEVLAGAATTTMPLFARGYIAGLSDHNKEHDDKILAGLDRLEDANPEMAVDLHCMNARLGPVFPRALKLVKRDRLGPRYLAHLAVIRAHEGALADTLELILEKLGSNKEDAAQVGLEVLHTVAYDAKDVMPQDRRTLDAVWRVVEMATEGASNEGHTWGRVVHRLAKLDPVRTAQVTARAAVFGHYTIKSEAMSTLGFLISEKPQLVLDNLGPLLLGKMGGLHFASDRSARVLNNIPLDMMKKWLIENGPPAAHAIARNLPMPYLDGEGKPVVPPLTAFVLETFETDDTVFRQFLAGNHSGQMYSGDIAGHHEREAALAKHFRAHPLRRIRDWALAEERTAKFHAQRWHEMDEEEDG